MTCEKYASSCRLLFIILKIPYLKALYIILIIFSLLTSFVPIHVNSSLKKQVNKAGKATQEKKKPLIKQKNTLKIRRGYEKNY